MGKRHLHDTNQRAAVRASTHTRVKGDVQQERKGKGKVYACVVSAVGSFVVWKKGVDEPKNAKMERIRRLVCACVRSQAHVTSYVSSVMVKGLSPLGIRTSSLPMFNWDDDENRAQHLKGKTQGVERDDLTESRR